MKSRNIIFAIVLVVAIIAMGYYYMLAEGCEDGRGKDYYFDANSLYSTGNFNISLFDISKVNVIAEYFQSCQISEYKINSNGYLKSVNYEEFKNYIENEKGQLSSRLLVRQEGGNVAGRIYIMSTGKQICGTGRFNEADCVPIGNVLFTPY